MKTVSLDVDKSLTTPLVSAIIATYNRRDYVCVAIDSVLAQTYPSVVLIVVDDGSTDGTGDMLRERYEDRIRYVYQANQGRSEARNHGMRLAAGEYIAFLDSDDLWEPDKLTRQIAFMREHPHYGMTHTFTSIIDSAGVGVPADTAVRLQVHGAGLRSGYGYEAMTRQCTMFLSTVVVRTEVAARIGELDPSIPAFEDWDWYLRAALETEIGTLAQSLTRYRRHEGNSTMTEFLCGERATSQKHLRLCEDLPEPVRSRVQRNLYVHLASVAYKEDDPDTCAEYMRKAAQFDQLVYVRPPNLRYSVAAFAPRALVRRLRLLKRSVAS
ncbi:MAG: glycosyltransferase family 2 protein [Chloroflexi bacterium]|nr:glycosyltransferase family 2 protein [Chloroflexota bacterium]